MARSEGIASWSRFPLHRPELFADLHRGEAALTKAMSANAKTFRPGDTIIFEAEPHSYVYWLRTGWVARARRMPDQRSQIIAVFLPGDFFGVKTVFLARQPDAMEALSAVTVEFLHHRQVLQLTRENPDVGVRLWWQVCEDQRRLHSWVAGLGRGNAEERIGAMLLDFRLRLHRAGLKTESFRLPMTQQQIADYLGLTVVHVNRVLRRLREAEMISLTRGRMVITDMRAVEQLARPIQDVFDRSAGLFDGESPNAEQQ
ncbi:MAG: Crp/Fnr family transcriptional regulator [Alphaproteobacteria bacterium]|nr:Crp/Fnr family transcriptional regulator [Alphaproteobacteria bacterium]